MQITGASGVAAGVTPQNELKALTRSKTGIEAAALRGDAFVWNSIEADIDAGDTMLFVRNDSIRPLHLDRLEICGSNVACTHDLGLGKATTTPTGTAVTSVNLNPKFGNESQSTAFGDETAVADATVFGRAKTLATEHLTYSLRGIVLERGAYIQINQETESTTGSCSVYGYYED